ncbi:MAG: hypothetical protein M9962_14915 [Oligoflexia bacterium]|nr:hypothetical protein [Oligoflexia bacterium]
MKNLSKEDFQKKFQKRFSEFSQETDLGFEKVVTDSILSVDFFCFLRDDLQLSLTVEKGSLLLKTKNLDECFASIQKNFL